MTHVQLCCLSATTVPTGVAKIALVLSERTRAPLHLLAVCESNFEYLPNMFPRIVSSVGIALLFPHFERLEPTPI